ncbi:MFS transporter [uncultured Thiocystis sp.]|jgi:EmrB/QacA subfamily drug resistance transporter|uniref:MFS transporter n=1 Tax=uncultured Thiocystis sp. TaxID=1202134 RepID=UPI0025D0481B|nr:MFS transporter [uncultured Thiocystis sp.]
MDNYVIAEQRRQWVMLLVVCFGAFMGNMDGTIVNVSLPTIAREMNLSPSAASLIVLAYLLFETGPLMAFGKLGDLFGSRPVFLSGFVLFTLSSLGCALTSSLWMLVLFRAIQGVGGSMIFSVMLTFVALYLPPEKRGRAMGLATMSAALGIAVGPTVGGFITHYLGWRDIFFINVPLGLIATIIGFRVLPKVHPPARDKRFDGLGAFYQTMFLLCFVFTVNQFHEYGWHSPVISSTLGASLLFAIFFIHRELSIAYPILDLRLFLNRNTFLATFNFCLSMMVMGGILFLMPFYLQDIRALEVNVIGLIMSIIALGQFMGPFAGQLGDRLGYRKVTLWGVLLGLVAFVMFVSMDFGEPLWWVIMAMTLFGVSQGLNRAPNIQLIMSSVPAELKSTAASITSLMRSLGLTLGVVVFETTFSMFIPKNISLDGVSLSHSGVHPSVLHHGFEMALIVGLAISVAMTVSIAFIQNSSRADGH